MNIISFPRSGQHLIYEILKSIYFVHDYDFTYCEYYDCCNSVPCIFRSIYQKNHDFTLNYNIIPTKSYVVFYRKNIIHQLEAYYRYKINKNNEQYDLEELLTFINNNFYYYINFYKKWIFEKHDNIMCIDYNSFVENPHDYVNQILQHSNLTFYDEKIKKILQSEISVEGKVNSIKILNTLNNELYQILKIHVLNKFDREEKTECVNEIISNIY